MIIPVVLLDEPRIEASGDVEEDNTDEGTTRDVVILVGIEIGDGVEEETMVERDMEAEVKVLSIEIDDFVNKEAVVGEDIGDEAVVLTDMSIVDDVKNEAELGEYAEEDMDDRGMEAEVTILSVEIDNTVGEEAVVEEDIGDEAVVLMEIRVGDVKGEAELCGYAEEDTNEGEFEYVVAVAVDCVRLPELRSSRERLTHKRFPQPKGRAEDGNMDESVELEGVVKLVTDEGWKMIDKVELEDTDVIWIGVKIEEAEEIVAVEI